MVGRAAAMAWVTVSMLGVTACGSATLIGLACTVSRELPYLKPCFNRPCTALPTALIFINLLLSVVWTALFALTYVTTQSFGYVSAIALFFAFANLIGGAYLFYILVRRGLHRPHSPFSPDRPVLGIRV